MSEQTASPATHDAISRLGPFSSVKGRIVGGFALICIVFALALSASVWQEQIHRSDLQELNQHSSTATLLQEAEAQAGIAALLLQRFVIAGDETLVAEIQSHAAAAVDSLTQAVAAGAPPSVDQAALSGAGLAQGTGRIIALREAGEIEAASAAMEDIVPIFRDFRLNLEDATAQELALVAEVRISADRAGNLAFLLLIASGGAGIAFALLVSMIIARSIIKPLTSLEATATAASQGDLSARAPATGPRELAHLGRVLNHMMSAVESHTHELSKAYAELKMRNQQLTDARVQALTDPLTGLGNHRSFHRRIRDEVTNIEGTDKPLSLIMFDIDGFKHVNDTLGHVAGDELLRNLTTKLEPAVQLSDAYRYGGDEFAVILAGRDRREALVTAEQLRSSIATLTPPARRAAHHQPRRLWLPGNGILRGGAHLPG